MQTKLPLECIALLCVDYSPYMIYVRYSYKDMICKTIPLYPCIQIMMCPALFGRIPEDWELHDLTPPGPPAEKASFISFWYCVFEWAWGVV